MRDTEIVASIAAGDPHGLATAGDRYAAPPASYRSSVLTDPADTATATADTFVVGASRPDGPRDPGRLRAWLSTAARDESLRMLRSGRGTPALDGAPGVSGGRADVSEQAERAKLKTMFEEASAGLNPGDREVIELQLRQGLAAGEVASVLGVSRSHAHSAASRARDQLEVCLSVLLVSRGGRGDCGELDSTLAGWDGRLTPLLRERVHRHIEHCATCAARRALELRPAKLHGRSPAAALAAGAAASVRLAGGAPSALKQHTLALAAGDGPAAAAHGAAVLARAGYFGREGFPEPVPAGTAGLAGQHVADGVRALRASPQRQAAVAAAVVLVAIAAAAFVVAGHDEHVTPSADPKTPTAPPPPAASAARAAAQPMARGPSSTAAAPASSTAGPADPATAGQPARSPASPATANPAPATALATTPAAAPARSPRPAPAPAVKSSPGDAMFTLYAGLTLPRPLAATAVVLPVPDGAASAARGLDTEDA
jgi:RNA polymerase sigma factor (sigma-70 family)